MPVTLKKMLNRGTTDPIVARTAFQASSLIDPFPLSIISKEEIFRVNHEICKKLIAMDEIAEWLNKEVGKIKHDFLSDGLKNIGENAYEIPQIIGLEGKVGSYLYSAKLALRDCATLFTPLFGTTMGYRHDKIAISLEKNLGTKSPIVLWLKANDSWMKRLIDMRNAYEHPNDSPRGSLHIRNICFDFLESKKSGYAPEWFFTGETPTNIDVDMRLIIRRILHLAEETVVFGLEAMYPDIPINFVEIPETQRNPSAPVRFRLEPRGNLVS